MRLQLLYLQLRTAAALFFIASTYASAQNLDLDSLVRNGGVRVERADGAPLLQYRDTEEFIPASTLKVATAFCALEVLGDSYRYQTSFLIDTQDTLFVRGSGDPSLISETLDSLARELANRINLVERIVIDTSAFEDNIVIDGSERSRNPYDAKNAAFVGNFSSALVTHTKRGEIVSAEPQTPLTPRARQAGLKLPRGSTERINLSTDWNIGVIYGGELLAAFLRKHGVRGSMEIRQGTVPVSAKEILRHESPQDLQEIVRGMLRFSTNFTANQIFLTLGAHQFGTPATTAKGQRAMHACLEKLVGWQDFHVEEGSGLSRKTRVSAQQMTKLLQSFERYSFLLPEQDGFLAKTGSLRGVNTLAGYFTLEGSPTPLRFVILVNSDVPHLHKFRVANEIRSYLKNNKHKHKNVAF
jgi:D-alanyl-D-alanine carboxypeptidase/D-alanyl-D-alanine-endopeptidase (penicillin-binding protein 4)